MNRQRYLEGMAAMGVLISRSNVKSETAVEIYWRVLQDLTDEQWERAYSGALATLKWFPTPAELRDLAGANVTVEQRAERAWEVVLAALDQVSIFDSIDFGPLVNRVVMMMGGLGELRNMDPGDLAKWGRKQFMEMYCNTEGFEGLAAPARCPGRIESNNANNPVLLQYKFKTVDMTKVIGQLETGERKALKGGEGEL